MLEPCKLPKCIIQNQSPKGEEILADGKYMSSIVPRHELIPRTASLRKIRRYEYGEQKKGKYAWNALSKNQEVLLDKDLLIKRLGHVIEHCQSLLHKLITDAPLIDFSNPVDEHDDAAAIAWGGDFAICATEAMEERKCTLGPTNTKRY